MGYLLITNDIEPYYRDVVNLMAQHYGCRYRFRYERSSGLDLIGAVQPTKMQGQSAVILLRCSETGDLIPIRRARIEQVFDSQHLVVLRFSVLDFPDPSLQSRWNILQGIVEQNAAENIPGGLLRPLIFELSDSDIDSAIGPSVSPSPRTSAEDFDRWRSVIDSISQLEFAKTSCFLYLHDIYEDDVTRLGRNRIERGVVLTGSDTSYRLEIASNFLPPISKPHSERDKIPEFSLVLKTDSAILSPLEDSSLVSSLYDDHNISFRVKGEFGGVGTRITVSPGEVQAGRYVPTIELPVYVRIASWQWFFVVVASILYMYSLFGIPRLAQKPTEGWEKLVQAIAIILLASIGKDSIGPLLKAVWNSRPLVEFRQAIEEMQEKRSS
jgi:hypothetical protein